EGEHPPEAGDPREQRARRHDGGIARQVAASRGVCAYVCHAVCHAGTRRRARRPCRMCRAHHTTKNRPAPIDSTTPTLDAAVERTVKRRLPTVSSPDGDSRVTRTGNAPDVRASTVNVLVVLRRLMSTGRSAPWGNSSLSLCRRTMTCTG